jgi:hypothetical protein
MLTLEVAEAFHIAFLSSLRDATPATSFALKGGGNLRFFLRSLRFSEDIDLDAFADNMRAFTPKVDRVLASQGLARLLGALGIKIVEVVSRERDRTATRGKWNIYLLHGDTGVEPVHTRIEMSIEHRELAGYVKVEPVNELMASAYSPLPAPMIGHYVPRGAVIQKVHALARTTRRPNRGLPAWILVGAETVE